MKECPGLVCASIVRFVCRGGYASVNFILCLSYGDCQPPKEPMGILTKIIKHHILLLCKLKKTIIIRRLKCASVLHPLPSGIGVNIKAKYKTVCCKFDKCSHVFATNLPVILLTSAVISSSALLFNHDGGLSPCIACSSAMRQSISSWSVMFCFPHPDHFRDLPKMVCAGSLGRLGGLQHQPK